MTNRKAVLIDVKNFVIRDMEIGDGLKPIYDAIGADCFDCVDLDNQSFGLPGKRRTVYIDDEGLLKEPTRFFHILGAPGIYAGSGLILTTDDEGESQSVDFRAVDLKSRVSFLISNEAGMLFNVFPTGMPAPKPHFEFRAL